MTTWYWSSVWPSETQKDKQYSVFCKNCQNDNKKKTFKYCLTTCFVLFDCFYFLTNMSVLPVKCVKRKKGKEIKHIRLHISLCWMKTHTANSHLISPWDTEIYRNLYCSAYACLDWDIFEISKHVWACLL